MTVKELIKLNDCIGDITITVRDGESGGKKLREYCIGVYAGQIPLYPDKRSTYKDIAINARDNGKDYYQILIQQIPKQWLGLNVQHFHTSKSHRSDWKQADHSFEHIYIDVHPEGWMEENEPEKKDDEKLEGQISIEDLMN